MTLIERLKAEIGNLVVQIHIMKGQNEELTAQLERTLSENARLKGAEPQLDFPLSVNGNGAAEGDHGERS